MNLENRKVTISKGLQIFFSAFFSVDRRSIHLSYRRLPVVDGGG